MDPAVSESASTDAVTLGFLLGALGSTMVSLQVAPAGTNIPIRSVSLLDSEDSRRRRTGARMARLCVLAGVSAEEAAGSIGRLSAEDSPSAVVIRHTSADLCRSAEAAGVAVGALHAQARVEVVLSTVRSLLEGAAARSQPDRSSGDAFVDASDCYGLAQPVAGLTEGSSPSRTTSPDCWRTRRLVVPPTSSGCCDPRPRGTGRPPSTAGEYGVFDRLRTSPAVVEVPPIPSGWHRRSWSASGRSVVPAGGVVQVRHWAPSGSRRAGARWTPTPRPFWRVRPRSPPGSSTGRATPGPRRRCRSSGCSGIRGGGVDIPSLVSALALPTSGPSAVVGIAAASTAVRAPRHGVAVPVAEIAAALRLLSGAYARDSLVTSTEERMYVLGIPGRDRSPWRRGFVASSTVRRPASRRCSEPP